MARIKQGSALGVLSLTPLIDIVFLLLIFYMATSEFDKEYQEQHTPVNLPSASEARPLIEKVESVVVTVTSTGRLIHKGREVDRDQLRLAFNKAAADNPGRAHVVIRADGDAKHAMVYRVMDLATQEGLRYKFGNRAPE